MGRIQLKLTTGWRQDLSEQKAIVLLRKAHSMGVNLIDTADVYGPSEGPDATGVCLLNLWDKMGIIKLTS